MRILATHNDKSVVIVAFLYEGEDHENLKAVYVNEDGEIDADSVENFAVSSDANGRSSFVDAVHGIKVKSW